MTKIISVKSSPQKILIWWLSQIETVFYMAFHAIKRAPMLGKSSEQRSPRFRMKIQLFFSVFRLVAGNE